MIGERPVPPAVTPKFTRVPAGFVWAAGWAATKGGTDGQGGSLAGHGT